MSTYHSMTVVVMLVMVQRNNNSILNEQENFQHNFEKQTISY